MANNNGRSDLAIQHLTQAGHIGRQRVLWELRRDDMVFLGLEPFDNTAPAGAVGPGTVDEYNVRSRCCHDGILIFFCDPAGMGSERIEVTVDSLPSEWT